MYDGCKGRLAYVVDGLHKKPMSYLLAAAPLMKDIAIIPQYASDSVVRAKSMPEN